MIQTYEPVGPGMTICISGGTYMTVKDHEQAMAEKEQEFKSLLEHHEAQTADFEDKIAALEQVVRNNAEWAKRRVAMIEERDAQIATLNQLNEDACEIDKAIRDLLRPLMDVDGDGDGVPTLESLVQEMIEQFAALLRNIAVLQELVNGNSAVELMNGTYYVPPPVAEYVGRLQRILRNVEIIEEAQSI